MKNIIKITLGVLALLVGFVIMLDLLTTILNPHVVYAGFSLLWVLLLMFSFSMIGVLLINRGINTKTGKLCFMKAVWYVLFVIYVITALTTLFSSSVFLRNNNLTGYASIKERVYQMNLIPTRTIVYYIIALFKNEIGRMSVAMNLLGNFVLFMPVAVFLPRSLHNSRINICVVIFVFLIVIEIMQFFTGRGNLDVDDVLLNFLGFYSVYLIRNIAVIQKMEDKAKLYFSK